MGPHPFPTVVRDFQSVIGKEIKSQMLEKEGRLPDVVMACVGGGSNAMGAFYEFIKDENVKLIGCEAAGLGIDTQNCRYNRNRHTRHLPRYEVVLLSERIRSDCSRIFNFGRS